MKKLTRLMMLAGLLAFYSCDKAVVPEPEPTFVCDTLNVSYANDIVPIMDGKCNSCHDGTATIGPSDFSVYANIKAFVDAGFIYNRVFVVQDMPQSGSLTNCEKDLLGAWINIGSPEN